MSFPPAPDAPDDELASAYLDGVADAEGRARVDSDPRLLARVEALRAVRTAVATPPPIDAAQRERVIAAALASVTPPEVVPLESHPRSKRWGRVGAAVVVAAAAAVAALIAVSVSHSGSGGNNSAGSIRSGTTEITIAPATTTAAAPTAAAAPTTAAGGASTTAASGGALSTIAPSSAAPVDLGEIDSAAALRDAATKLASAPLNPVATAGVADTGGANAAACSPEPGAALAGRLAWQGTPALLYVVADGSGNQRARRAIVVAAADCHILATVPLA